MTHGPHRLDIINCCEHEIICVSGVLDQRVDSLDDGHIRHGRCPLPDTHVRRNTCFVTDFLEADVNPCCLIFLSFRIIPESPRWLNQHHHYEKAQQVLKKIAEKNNKPVPSLEMLKKAANVDLKEEARLRKYTYIDLFRYRTYAIRTVILIALW